nr:hypothetical protein [Tanacetum cinerariifolium]
RSKKVKEGVGYNAVPPPAADLYPSPKKDLSWTGLPEFVDNTGASFTQGTVSSIPIGGNISLEGFLLPILLLVVIIIMVMIVVVILIVVVAIIGVVVVVGGVFIIKLLFVIIGNLLIKASISISVFGTMFGHKMANSWNLLTSRTILICKETFQFNPGDLVGLLYPNSGDIVDLIGNEDPTDEDGDTEVSVSLGEISSKGKKSWESDIGDCDNTVHTRS